jgi:GT2 family glycosyltransferase
MKGATITAVVPSLGRSPWLERTLDSLRADGEEMVRITVIPEQPELAERCRRAGADHVITLPGSPSFTSATNAGLAAATTPWVATVNDDVEVEPGWAAALRDVLERERHVAAVQGVNLARSEGSPGPGESKRVDGMGLAWTRRWQAVQLGHDRPPAARDQPVRPLYGVSATAALWRRDALLAVAAVRGNGQIFREALGSYYDDVELAGQLRALGWQARLAPSARAHHRASTTGRQLGWRRWSWVHGNRWLVLADLLGGSFWLRTPRLLGRDLLDLSRVVLRAEGGHAAGIVTGWGRALRALPRFARLGAPRVPLEELHASFPESER